MFETLKWTWGRSVGIFRAIYQGECLYRELAVHGRRPSLTRELEIEVSGADGEYWDNFVAGTRNTLKERSMDDFLVITPGDEPGQISFLIPACPRKMTSTRYLPYIVTTVNSFLGVDVDVRLGPWTSCEHVVKMAPCECTVGLDKLLEDLDLDVEAAK